MATIRTLGEAFSAGWSVHMRCGRGDHRGIAKIEPCGFKATLNMETLVCTRGRTFALSRLASRLECPNCGERFIHLDFVVPGSNEPSFRPTSPWRATPKASQPRLMRTRFCGALATACVTNDQGQAFYCDPCTPTEVPLGRQPAYPVPVCNLYSITSSQAAIRQLARAIRDLTGNMPPLPAVFPDQMAPVVRTGADGQRELVMMR